MEQFLYPGKEYSEPLHKGTFVIFLEMNIHKRGITELFSYFRKGTFRALTKQNFPYISGKEY